MFSGGIGITSDIKWVNIYGKPRCSITNFKDIGKLWDLPKHNFRKTFIREQLLKGV